MKAFSNRKSRKTMWSVPVFAGSVALVVSVGAAGASSQKKLDITPARDSYATRANEGGHAYNPTGTGVDMTFTHLDANSNLILDRYEAAASKELKEHFAQVDKNHDEQISPAEYQEFERQEMKEEQNKATESEYSEHSTY